MLAGPLVTTLFQYGATTPEDARMMANSLVGFALGLIGLILVKVLAPGFFARQNTKTPVRVGVIAMIVNIIVAILLVVPLKHVGLATATSVAAWVNAGLLFRLLRKESIYQPRAGWQPFMLKIAIAGSLMAVVVYWMGGSLEQWFDVSTWGRVYRLTLCVTMGAAVYFLIVLALGIRPKHLLLNRAEFDS